VMNFGIKSLRPVVAEKENTMDKTKPPRLNSTKLKIIAVIIMLIDHVAYLSDTDYYTFPAVAFHIIGRIAAPIFLYLMARGYSYTRSPARYGYRLLVFAVISQVPYILFSQKDVYHLNILFTLFFGLQVLRAICEEKRTILKAANILTFTALILLCDYGIFALLIILIAYFFGGNRKYFAFTFAIVALLYCFESYADLPVTLILLFFSAYLVSMGIILLDESFDNNRQATYKKPGRFGRYVFYVFYPAHLAVLWAVSLIK
jgi:hypothetical protein